MRVFNPDEAAADNGPHLKRASDAVGNIVTHNEKVVGFSMSNLFQNEEQTNGISENIPEPKLISSTN